MNTRIKITGTNEQLAETLMALRAQGMPAIVIFAWGLRGSKLSIETYANWSDGWRLWGVIDVYVIIRERDYPLVAMISPLPVEIDA